MKVTYLGHAALLIETRGLRILMDPWLTDPTYHGSWWHYPPLALGPEDLPPLDYIYVSHEHPDHFDPPTLRALDRRTPVLIADFRRKRFRDRIRALGFEQVIELPWQRDFACGDGVTLRLIPPDRPWDDSAILVRDGETTLLNVNDCHLDDATLQALGRNFSIDIAFLTFTGASQYPGCFDFPLESKIERWRASKQAHLQEFVDWAKLLRTRRAVPAAGNYALLAPDQLELNTPDYVNTPQEAVEALAAAAPEIEGLQMNPGDVWTPERGLDRFRPPPDWNRRMDEIHEMSRRVAPAIAAARAAEPPAPPDLFDRFRAYFEGLLSADPRIAPRVGICTWWHVTGPAGGDWTLDFRRERDWVREGAPEDWNLRIEMEDRLVAQGVSGAAIWDEIILSFRVRLARRPDHYMKEFWTWFCKL